MPFYFILFLATVVSFITTASEYSLTLHRPESSWPRATIYQLNLTFRGVWNAGNAIFVNMNTGTCERGRCTLYNAVLLPSWQLAGLNFNLSACLT